MKKNISYRDKLLELAQIYKIQKSKIILKEKKSNHPANRAYFKKE